MERSKTSDPPGTRIADRYRVVAALGRGGMGRVYRAVDETTGKRIALKRAMFPKDREAKLAPLFEREFQTLAVLDHPCIIRVHDFGRDERGPYYTMELLEGQDLRELSPLPYRDACRYLRDVASSLALLHARRLVHRDVSPGNVRIGGDGHAKLIDFGALASFGAHREMIGTPPCVPPEAVRAGMLDQRSDLFAFGAVLYYALTGKHAYVARDFASLHSAWLVPPPRPSSVVPGIPEALDELVLSLLSLEPVARPQAAAAVIDQLSVIADLETGGEQHLAEAYLRSAVLVGRDRELRKLQKRLDSLASQRVQVAVLSGPSGIGKTRLLSELALRARLVNHKVIHAAAELHREPYGVLRKLALDLLDGAPELATRAAEPHAAVLGHIVPELRERLPAIELERMPPGGVERRARLQRALAEWLLEVGQAMPLVITIDNLEHADESSVACIASLAHSDHASILIAVTLDPTQARAEAALAQLPRESALAVTPLLEVDVCALVQALFGDVAHLSRFARVLQEASGGNPGLCLQLARHLIRTGHIQYSGGAWLLPQELRRSDLPAGIEEVLLARLRKLPASTRDIAKLLSVSRIGMSLPLVASLAKQAQPAVLCALDELVATEVVVDHDSEYRFGHESLRKRVLDELDAEPKRVAQRALAEALFAGGESNDRQQLESGFQLMQSGAALEGARRLAKATQRIAEQHVYTSELLGALELALEVLESHGAAEAECLLLRVQLAVGSFRVDHRIATKYGLATMERLQRYIGLSAASRLAPLLGDRLALRAGTFFAGLRHRLRGRPSKEFRALFKNVFAAWMTLLGVAALCMDRERIERLMQPMRVVQGFGSRSLAAFAYTLGSRMQAQTNGEEHRAEELSLKALDALRDPQVVSNMSQPMIQSYRGGVLFGLGLTQVFRADDSAARTAQAMNALGLAMYEVVGAQVALIAHAYRGETELAQGFQRQVEALALRGGSAWQTEIFILNNMLAAHYFTGDVVHVKQAAQQLSRLSADIPTLSVFTGFATAITQLNRGRYAEAVTTAELLLPEFEPRKRNGWAMLRAVLAAAYTGTGQPARAERLCHDTLALYGPGEREYPLMYAHIERELARAENALGRHGEARARIAELLQRYVGTEMPLLLGLLHRDAAELALARVDQGELARHIERARHYFQGTAGSPLIASIERLAKRAERGPAAASTGRSATNTRADALAQELRECTDYEKRAGTLLRALVETSEAGGGFLVLFADGAPYVANALPGDPPPPDSLMIASSTLRDGESISVTASSVDSASPDTPHSSTVIQLTIDNETMSLHPFPLCAERSRRNEIIGIAWLARRPGRSFTVDRALLDAGAYALSAQ